ncbi:hypothetical protein CHUAL_004522 [Chamberlinius hualienensis]
MDEDTEYLKLPVDEMCQHKLWKARLKGYELALKQFNQIADDKSPEWNKYLGLVKKFVVDSNVPAQEKGLEAVLAFVENAACAGKSCGEVMGGLVTKCLGAPKAKTKEKAMEIIMMYIEIEKYEIVQDELMKGLTAKVPKIVVACIQCLRDALRDFGPKVITLKPIVKQLQPILEDRDKGVRDEAKLLTVEVYRWIGTAFKSQLANLKPVQLTELEAEFEKLGTAKASPTRFLRSQQAARAKVALQAEQGDGDVEEDEVDAVEEIDTYELLQPVNILSQLPKDFYEKVEAKKWQERKEVIDQLLPLTSNPKLEVGDYGDLVRALKKIVSKDSNVMIVAAAGKCLAGIANGLKKKFQPYVGQCFSAVLEKFKEKKQNVVLAMREAVDAMYAAVNLDYIQDDLLASLENKNPSIKSETAAFIARAFAQCDTTMLTKKHLKVYCPCLVKALNDPDPTVRDNVAEALGTAMKVVGEKVITTFIQELDNVKQAKIKECCDKAQVVGPKTVPKKKSAPVKTEPKSSDSSSSDNFQTAAAKPATGSAIQKSAPVRKPPADAKKGPTKQPVRKGTKPAAESKSEDFIEKELSSDEVDEKAAELLSQELLNGLGDVNWKTRLSSMEQMMQTIKTSDLDHFLTQTLARTLVKKPGLKENNFQVLKLKLEAIAYLASNAKFSKRSAMFVTEELAEKIGDSKNGSGASDALTAIAEATKLDYVASQVLDYVFSQKSPKNQVEAMNWLGNSIKEFGLIIQVKPVIDHIKKALAATNPAVRTAAVTLLGVMYMYMGTNLRVLFENEKSSLLQQIDAEFEKLQGVTPPAVTRGIVAKARVDSGQDEEFVAESQPVALADLIPRTDISSQITSTLLNEMSDKNWKERLEALQKLATIINEVKFITPNLGDLPTVFKARLLDSNKNLAIQALNICQSIGTGMGPSCNKYVRGFAPALFSGLGDGKANVRSAALSCLNAWVEQCGFLPFLEGEMIFDALKLDNPNIKIEMLGWLSEHLSNVKSIPTGDLTLCVPLLLTALEDRSPDVRKKAQDAVLPFMLHLGYDLMSRATSKLKPASKMQTMAILDKVKPNLPVKVAPAKTAAGGAAVKKVVKPSGKSGDSVVNGSKMDSNAVEESKLPKTKLARPLSQGRSAIAKPSTGKKKDEESDSSPPIIANNLKEQRIYDEQKLKVLKWNFITPRDEFYELLQDQMTVAGFNKALLTQLFHSDFKFHLKAIDTFVECLENLPEASIANLDLILKWLALRFFDTNPSVLLKGLEYLQALFQNLESMKYHLHEYEAASFVPYLILKVGDPKDAVRQGVRAIFRLLYIVYPANKIFNYLLDGLKSKNARQRTECLDELGFLIEKYGICVCLPNPQTALREIAKQISDRDNSVRNAALNCVVQAYLALDGEKVFKFIGPISDKDMSLLEERIKRTCKSRPAAVPPPVVVPPPKAPSPETKIKTPIQRPTPVQTETITRERVVTVSNRPSRPISGIFSLDFDKMDLSVDEKYDLEMPKLVEHDIDELSEPVKFPETQLRPPSPSSVMANNSRDAVSAVDTVINQAGSNDITVSVQALAQIDELLKLEERAIVMISRVDYFLVTAVRQYKIAYGMTYTKRLEEENSDSGDAFTLYRNLTMSLVSLFSLRSLAKRASKDVLKDLIHQLITILLDSRLPEFQNGRSLIRSINVLIIKIEETGDPTNVMCSLIKLLHDCVANDNTSEKFTDLIMKCIWKMVNLLPGVINEMNLDKVLLDLHVFLKAFPSPIWKERPRDTPLRTVKTVLHALAKHKGNKVLNHLSLINDTHESEIESYLKKVLKGGVRHRSSRSTNADDHNRAGGGTDQPTHKREHRHSPRRLSKTTHEMLAEIFKKIGSKETTKDGLADLHRFKKCYPEADITPFLCKSSTIFQNYIERGLQNVEQEDIRRSISPSGLLRQNMLSVSTGNIPSSVSPKGAANDSGENANVSPTELLERLKAFRARCGYDTPMQENGANRTISRGLLSKAVSLSGDLESQIRDEVTVIRQLTRHETVISHTVNHSNSSEGLSQITTSGSVEDLRRRLERIKSSKS